MGANEKHEATYHGGEYVPSAEEVRNVCVIGHYPHPTKKQRETLEAQFDRWLAAVKAEALTDLADQMQDRFTASWIRGKARELTHGPRKITGAFAIPEPDQEADCGDNDL